MSTGNRSDQIGFLNDRRKGAWVVGKSSKGLYTMRVQNVQKVKNTHKNTYCAVLCCRFLVIEQKHIKERPYQ